MKYSMLTVLFLLPLAGIVFSQPDDRSKEDHEKAATQKKEAHEGTHKPVEQEWPPAFEPSEKVGADSVISFPTDI